MKRIASVLLTLVMILGLAVSAFADGETTAGPTISVTDDREYEVYQIFTGDLHEGTLSNIKWGANGTGTVGDAVAKDTLTTLAGLTNSSDLATPSHFSKRLKQEMRTFHAVGISVLLDDTFADGTHLKLIKNK